MSYALTRYRWGKLTHCEPSRFLDDVDQDYLDIKFASVKPTRNTSFEKKENRGSSTTKFVPKTPRAGLKKLVKTPAKTTAPITGILKEFKVGMKSKSP